MLSDQRDEIARCKHVTRGQLLAIPAMACGVEVPESIRNQIVGMRLWGAPFPAIAAQLPVKANTAKKIYYRWEETGDRTSASKSGAPKKLNERDLTHIKRHLRHDRNQRRQPLGEIIINLNLPVSEDIEHEEPVMHDCIKVRLG